MPSSDGALLCPPFTGIVLWNLYQQMEDRTLVRQVLSSFFPQAVLHHRHWYNNRDSKDEGLLCLVHPNESPLPKALTWDDLLDNRPARKVESATEKRYRYGGATSGRTSEEVLSDISGFAVQDPFHNALLCLSNECLIRIGEVLRKDVLELVEWNELSVFSMNDKLWDEEYGIYRAYDMVEGKTILSGSVSGIMPMIAAIPTQEQAEAMRATLTANFIREGYRMIATNSLYADRTEVDKPYRGAIHLWYNWLLFQGLRRYDFEDLALILLKDTLDLVEEYGFHNIFNPRKSAVAHLGIGPGAQAVAAGLYLNLIEATAVAEDAWIR